MKIDIKILNELKRYNQINNYIAEQEAAPELPPPPGEEGTIPPPAEGTIPPPVDAMTPPVDTSAVTPETPAEPVDVSSDPDVEKVGDEKGKDKEELEITDLVKSQKNIEDKQEEYFEQLFNHLGNLENKLGEMDNIVNKLNDLEAKVEKYRTKSPEEKLELRSLDSGPFNQKLSDFFDDKEEEFEKLGRDEYILTQDEVEDYSPNEIKKSFRSFNDLETPDNFKKIS